MTRQAITTKWLGPTNSRGSRVKAKASAGSVTVPWDYSKNTDANHAAAAKELADKYGWGGVWVEGGLPDGSGNVYVALPLNANVVETPAFVTEWRDRP